ncbi:MAG: arginine--tRNA ligase, partial [Chlorobi bacterium]|nr:arginine--tRNA ligase [Chlorobiota bacterium]
MVEYLRTAFHDALKKLGIDFPKEEIQFEIPKQPQHGDLATNVALQLARVEKSNPREIAVRLIEALELDPAMISAVEPAGPGFINIRMNPGYIVSRVAEILEAGVSFGKVETGKGRSANVEWVSANPTGPLHAGHGRQVCLGAAICNLLEWSGWNVTREYYFNNAGVQMQNLGRSVQIRYLQALGDEVEMEEGLYNGEYIKEIAAEIKEEFGDSKREESIDFFRKRGEEWCFARIKETLERLEVHHDIFFNEDTLYRDGKIDEVLSILREKGLVYEQEGAVWFRSTKFGAEKDRVFVKSTGEPTYRLPDVAYHREKILRGYDQVIDIFGADHIATIPDVLAAVRAMGLPTDHVRVVIHQMVSFVEGGESVKMSKRSAKVYSLDDLIDDVGADVVKYFFVMRAANTHLDFDLELAREQSEKNPVYYLQYAHARIASLIRFAESEGVDLEASPDLAL